MPDLEPITREEKLLDGEDLTPITRKEMFIKRIYDKTQEIPEPITREEMFLKKAGEGGGGDIDLQTLNVTENGTVNAPSGVAYNKVVTNVPIPSNAYFKKSVPNLPAPIASFSDGADIFMPSLKVGIEPVQAGSGDPSPENIRPIIGWTEEVITRTGANIWGGKKSADDIQDAVSTAIIDTTNKTVEFGASEVAGIILSTCKFKENTSYTFIMTYSKSKANLGSNMRVRYTDGTLFEIPSLPSGTAINEKKTVIVTSDANKTIQAIEGRNQGNTTTLYYDESGVFEGTITEQDFEQYAGTTYTIPFKDGDNPLIVYGGTLDVTSGVLTVDREYRVIASSELLSTSALYTTVRLGDNGYIDMTKSQECNMLSFHDGTAPTLPIDYFKCINSDGYNRSHMFFCFDGCRGDTPAQTKDLNKEKLQTLENEGKSLAVCFGLVTPITYQLTPTQVKSLLGHNNIWADTGDVIEAEYLSKEV